MKLNIIEKYSRNKSLGAVFAERFTRTIRNLLKKPVVLKGNAEWLSALPSVFKQYNITIHHSQNVTNRCFYKIKRKRSLFKSPRQERKTKTSL